MSNATTQFATNFKAGLRASFFLRPVPSESQANWSHLMLVFGLMLLVQFLSEFIQVGPDGTPSTSGISSAGLAMSVLLVAAWIATKIAGRPERTLPFALVFSLIYLCTGTVLTLVQQVFGALMNDWRFDYFYVGTVAWIMLASAVAAARMVPAHPLQKAWAGMAVAVLIGVHLVFLHHGSSLWDKPYDAAEARASYQREQALNQEDVFYAQPKLLDQALDAVVPARGNDIQLFAVLAGSYAEQDVFMKEVQFVNTLLQKRFGTAGHSVMLINNVKTVNSQPIASATSIGRSLQRIGAVMDKERDILFLYLTSHGSEEHKFAVDFGAMEFNDVDPKRLRAMLDASGIKRRVIVISACYSGGFIDALKDEHSLVITAAAANRKSFGCSNEADFTYFGKAYFEQALAETYSFIDAFEKAAPLIAAREKQQAYLPSEPRIFVGAGIRPALAQLARQRSEKAVK